MCELSGGWRLRIALALALIACTQESGAGDVLLLDEPTNHRKYLLSWECITLTISWWQVPFVVDLPTIVWLQRYLVSKCEHLICVVVSHDRWESNWCRVLRESIQFLYFSRALLDAVCTDVAEFKDEKIVYFPGGYSLWERNQSEMEVITLVAHILVALCSCSMACVFRRIEAIY